MRKNLVVKVVIAVVLMYLSTSCGGGGGGGGLLIPAAPGGVQIVVGDGFVTVSWAAAQGATSYTIYFASAPGVKNSNYSTLPDGAKRPNSTSPAQITGLTNGKTYYFVVTGSNSAGESPESQEVNGTPTAPPDTIPPTNIQITGGVAPGQQVSGTISLSATAQDDSGTIQKMEFHVSSADPSLACSDVVAKPSGSTFSCNWNSAGVTNGPHSGFARAYDPANNSADSALINFTVNNPPPAAPQNVRSVAGNGQVSVYWDSSPGAISYNIYMASEQGVTKANYATKADGMKHGDVVSPFTHTGLTNDRVYYFVVTAENGAGESAESSEVSGTPSAGLLSGPANDAANAHIPDIPIPPGDRSDLVYAREIGMSLSTSEALLIFKPTTTVQEANALLQSIGGSIQGGIPGRGWVFIRLSTPRTPAEYLHLFDVLESDSRVSLASPESALVPKRIPGPDPTNNPGLWEWTLPAAGGNWGLEASRVPQAWNFLDFLYRSGSPQVVGVMDVGFNGAHPDLTGVFALETFNGQNPNTPDSHGTGVSGLISALFHNYGDADGVNPLSTVVGAPVGLAMGNNQDDDNDGVVDELDEQTSDGVDNDRDGATDEADEVEFEPALLYTSHQRLRLFSPIPCQH